jgi:cell wall assembly regulator SMI1
MAIEETIRALDDVLRAKRPAYHATLRDGLDDAALAASERELGRAFPPELAALYRWRNGQVAETGHTFYGEWSFLSFTELLDVVRTNEELARNGVFAGEALWWDGRWTPFLTDGSDNYQCVDPVGSYENGTPGQILTYLTTAHRREIPFLVFDALLAALATATEDVADDGEAPADVPAPPGYPRRLTLPYT